MTKLFVAVVVAGMLGGAGMLWAGDRAPKGPAEDGTLPALVKNISRS